jgi:hypothetical protein
MSVAAKLRCRFCLHLAFAPAAVTSIAGVPKIACIGRTAAVVAEAGQVDAVGAKRVATGAYMASALVKYPNKKAVLPKRARILQIAAIRAISLRAPG